MTFKRTFKRSLMLGKWLLLCKEEWLKYLHSDVTDSLPVITNAWLQFLVGRTTKPVIRFRRQFVFHTIPGRSYSSFRSWKDSLHCKQCFSTCSIFIKLFCSWAAFKDQKSQIYYFFSSYCLLLYTMKQWLFKLGVSQGPAHIQTRKT